MQRTWWVEASRELETLSGEQTVKLVGDPNVILVDQREGEELQKTGKLQGAVHVPRDFLEFQADPTSPSSVGARSSFSIVVRATARR